MEYGRGKTKPKSLGFATARADGGATCGRRTPDADATWNTNEQIVAKAMWPRVIHGDTEGTFALVFVAGAR